MSKYALNSFLYRIRRDPEYRKRFVSQPDSALEEWNLSDPEKTALRRWDIRELNKLGGYLHMLIGISNILKQAGPGQEFQYNPDKLSSMETSK
jgi:hypothetical protein